MELFSLSFQKRLSIPTAWFLVCFAGLRTQFSFMLADSPGDRQIYLSAIPLALGLGVLFRRLSWTAVPLLAFLAILLGYWYSLDTSAHHRSDWRGGPVRPPATAGTEVFSFSEEGRQ